MPSQPSAIILAGGFSSRMHAFKPLLPLGNVTLLDQSITLFRSCGIDDIMVVTGYRAQEVNSIAERAGARTVHNADFAEGMFSSIQTGIRHLGPQNGGFFLHPVDMPLVRRGTIKLLLDAQNQATAKISYPQFAGRRGHPALFPARFGPMIAGQTQPDGGLRTLLAQIENKHPKWIRDVAVADVNIHTNMNTPDDYFTGYLRYSHHGIPTIAEAEAILKLHPMPKRGLAHGNMVGAMAANLCLAIIEHTGRRLSPHTCRICGLLHDIAKGHPPHEQTGARWLNELGFDQAAEIVGAHKDLQWSPGMEIRERELVHLADKLVRGRYIIGVHQRFSEKLALYANDPATVHAISDRYQLALNLSAAVERLIGQPIEQFIKMIFHGIKTLQ